MLKQGVLLVNLGSPASTSVKDVRRYLREFLMDSRVIDRPYPIRFALVYGIIAPFRAKHSAEAYRKVWTAEGSPLVTTSQRLANALQDALGVHVGIAMRYQKPSVEEEIEALSVLGVRNLLVVPLFPHYAMSSYESAVAHVRHVAERRAPWLTLTVVPPYYQHPQYIESLVASTSEALAEPYDHLLFSFHGVPERHIAKKDPSGCHCLKVKNCCEVPSSPADGVCYRRQCLATVKSFAAAAGLEEGRYSYSFQSRLGKDKWLSPATADQLARLAHSGVKRLVVMCPAFTVDCLETLEEIGIRGRETFLAEGGAEFRVVPCLNDHPVWVKALARLAEEHGVVAMSEPDAATVSQVR